VAERGKPGGWHDADDPLANERILVTMTSSPEPDSSKGPESEELSEPVEAFADESLAFQADPDEPPVEAFADDSLAFQANPEDY
jgi:hypothetical protein